MKIAFHTLGCKVNQYETESMREKFCANGYSIVGETDFADAYIINTCTVTALADRKSRQYIRRMKKLNPDSVILVTGCYVQVNPDQVSAIEGVDIICGTNEKENAVRYIEEYLALKENERKPAVHVKRFSELSEYVSGGIITSMESRTRAYIKIEEGCDRFCSYCIIPFARGSVRCRERGEILKEAEALVGKGFKELILTGINTALYDDLPGLLADLDEIDGNFRIRLSSLEPTVIDKRKVQKILGAKRLCHHLHLSVQSGSDKILRLMNRPYDRKQYLDIVTAIREFDPLYGITTDIIAGFPQEDDNDHIESLDMISKAEFCKVHAFGFSKRPGTKAATMSGQIDATIKKFRVKQLIAEGERVSKKFMQKNIGRIETVLFEEEQYGMPAGYTGNYIKAYTEADISVQGRLVSVEITGLYRDGVKVKVL